MSERRASEERKVELYMEHREAVEDVKRAFEEEWERFTQTWSQRLEDRLQEVGHDTDSWRCTTSGGDWGFMFKAGWWRNLPDLEPIDERGSDRKDVRIALIHRLQKNRDLALDERMLEVHLRNCGSNDAAFRNHFADAVEASRGELEAALPSAAEVTGEQRNVVTARYGIEVDAYSRFFEAYVGALQRAMEELVVENDEFEDLITGLFEESVEELYGGE